MVEKVTAEEGKALKAAFRAPKMLTMRTSQTALKQAKDAKRVSGMAEKERYGGPK